MARRACLLAAGKRIGQERIIGASERSSKRARKYNIHSQSSFNCTLLASPTRPPLRAQSGSARLHILSFGGGHTHNSPLGASISRCAAKLHTRAGPIAQLHTIAKTCEARLLSARAQFGARYPSCARSLARISGRDATRRRAKECGFVLN